MADMKNNKSESSHIEVAENDSLTPQKTATDMPTDGHQLEVTGTVKLTEGAIVYVPTPTADPQDPLNMPMWQKYVVLLMLSLCKSLSCFRIINTHQAQIVSTLGLSLVSGLGGLLGFYIPIYAAQGYGRPEITALMTYPALFM